VDLQTDEEKAEAIKKWWKENGVAVITGVAVGLAAIFGWRAWTGYQERLGQQASLAFEELLITVNQATAVSPETETETETEIEGENPLLIVAREQSTRLNDDFRATPYAFLAQLAMAKVYNDQGDLGAAADALQAAIKQAPTPLLETLAALRLTRVLVAAGDHQAADKLINTYGRDEAFAADFAALRGDLALTEERFAEARAAYEQALAGHAGAAGLIRLKLQELPQ
jgi:predicted negative regulator of RcsB-dependent stress response